MIDDISKEIILKLEKLEQIINSANSITELAEIRRRISIIMRLLVYTSDKLEDKFEYGDLNEKGYSKNKRKHSG